MSESSEPQRRRPTVGRQVASWVWALAPAWSLGFGTAPCMIVATVRLRHWLQTVLTVLYAVTVVVMLVYAGYDDGTTQDSIFEIALAFNIFVGTGHGLAVRRRMFFGPEAAAGPGRTAPPTALDAQQRALEGLGDTLELRRQARAVVEAEPSHAIELRIGRVDLPGREFPDGGLVDVNNVPTASLVREVPALAAYADDLARALATVRAFGSVEDLSVTLSLPAHLLDHVADRLVFLPRYEA